MRKYPALFFSRGLIQTLPLLIIALFIIIGSVIVSKSKTPSSGLKSSILSESGESGGSSSGDHGGSSSSGSGESGSSSSGGSSSGSSGSTAGPKPEEKEKTEVKTEIRLPSGIRVKTEDKKDKMEAEIIKAGRKLKFEIENGKIKVKVETEAGEEEELPELEDENIEVEEATHEGNIRVNLKDKKLAIEGRRLTAQTSLPVSVDLATRQLTITTPAGEKVVAVLPDQAVANMLAANIINREQAIEVKIKPDGTLEYEIRGLSDEKFLGLINVAIPKTVEVSPETGQLLGVNQSLIDRFLDLISF